MIGPVSLTFTLLVFSLAACGAAAILLAIEVLAAERIAKRSPGVAAISLAVIGIGCSCSRIAAWFSPVCWMLSCVLLAIWPLCFEFWRRPIRQLLVPRTALLVVLCGGLVAARYLAAHALNSIELPDQPIAVEFGDSPVHGKHATTDRGRPIRLFHFTMFSSAKDVEPFERANEKGKSQIIRLAESNPASNCHGWVFTGGQYGIRDPDVPSILQDNGYVEVSEPREGDVAVYFLGAQVTHSGLVRLAARHAPRLVESKWGPFGVYLHEVHQHPFPGVCKFYRSTRSGHLLDLVNAAESVAN